MDAMEMSLVSAMGTTVRAGVELLIVAAVAVTSLLVVDRIVNGKKKH